MELKDTKYGKIIIMNFVTAEHCGISFGNLDFEANISNINLKEEMPIAIIIQFKGGFIITPNTKEETINAMAKDTTNFHKFIDALSKTTPSKKS